MVEKKKKTSRVSRNREPRGRCCTGIETDIRLYEYSSPIEPTREREREKERESGEKKSGLVHRVKGHFSLSGALDKRQREKDRKMKRKRETRRDEKRRKGEFLASRFI